MLGFPLRGGRNLYYACSNNDSEFPMRAIDQVRHHAPAKAVTYKYTIHYFAESGEQIREANQTLVLNSEEEKDQTQLHMELGTGGTTGGSSLPSHSASAGDRADNNSDSAPDFGAESGSCADDEPEFRTEVVEDEEAWEMNLRAPRLK